MLRVAPVRRTLYSAFMNSAYVGIRSLRERRTIVRFVSIVAGESNRNAVKVCSSLAKAWLQLEESWIWSTTTSPQSCFTFLSQTIHFSLLIHSHSHTQIYIHAYRPVLFLYYYGFLLKGIGQKMVHLQTSMFSYYVLTFQMPFKQQEQVICSLSCWYLFSHPTLVFYFWFLPPLGALCHPAFYSVCFPPLVR